MQIEINKKFFLILYFCIVFVVFAGIVTALSLGHKSPEASKTLKSQEQISKEKVLNKARAHQQLTGEENAVLEVIIKETENQILGKVESKGAAKITNEGYNQDELEKIANPRKYAIKELGL